MTFTWRPWRPACGITIDEPGAATSEQFPVAHNNDGTVSMSHLRLGPEWGGDFKAGANGDSTLPSAAMIVSTRLGLICFICLIKLYQRTGGSSAEPLQFLKLP